MLKATKAAMLVLAAILVGCGGSSPTAPTPTPAPTQTLTFDFDAAGYAGNRSFSFATGTIPAPGQLDVNVMGGCPDSC